MTYHADIIEQAKANPNFRPVVASNWRIQVVLMALQPGEDIGQEIHSVDQVLVFVEGTGTAKTNNELFTVGPGQLAVIPAGAKHNFTNRPKGIMKFYTLYAPPEHRPGTIHKTKAEAKTNEHNESL